MGKIWNGILNNPVRTFAIVQAALAGFVSFGLHLSADQIAAIMAFAAVILGVGIPPTVTPKVALKP